MKITLVLWLEFLACTALCAGQPMPQYSTVLPATGDELNVTEAAAGPYVIFSNLDSITGDRFNTNPFGALPVAGKTASGNQEERWDAIRFSPTVDVQAKTLSAAIGYISGTKRFNLGIYANNANTGSVGALLPGGQASITDIPDSGQCCQLAKATLPGEGVTLTGGTVYWLVASPDNVAAPDFHGAWQTSNRVKYSAILPPAPWQDQSGIWPAAEVRGTKIKASNFSPADRSSVQSNSEASKAIIFSNLDRNSTVPFIYGSGISIHGSQVPSNPEIWYAFPFTPTSDAHAKTLGAAIAWKSGTRLIVLGIYNDEGGKVGTPLPGGEGSTTRIPELGDCCELTRVRLTGAGVPVSAGVQYWLVARTDDALAPTFDGAWQTSSLAINAYQAPENLINWTDFDGTWLAVEIRGSNP